MKFTDLKYCPFCGCEEFYEKRRTTGTVTYYMRFDGDEADNSCMYEGLEYTWNGKVWCAECDRYLGNQDDNKVGVEAERAYRKKDEVADG